MKFRYTRLNTNQGMNDGPDALTHTATFEVVSGAAMTVGPGMGMGAPVMIPMSKAEADQLTMGQTYIITLTPTEG